ncbi:SKI family transcriptional corepressor 1 isoform X2 [Ambystoma mexicanum]|uniref:SKI family transcriptional corepressor 1 isoform X2 n=1 Tax=Ambystoma mexicanum TaxID=8296 RepID=UPI0037E7AFD0
MEAITPQLGAGREVAPGGSPSSPASKQELHPYSSNLKPNQVGETSLYGVPIVSLVIDGQERLCLAQISNTLLKNYSYNEIHNRRVALGITCVQCTPVQLEILRRAGAMPISSRRCGMITKREAERLCKSFLGEHRPPKLPENFAFDVVHECAWGSRGSFIPARYNSSRAKCIKCAYCSLYFSPNKFIFHSHRTPEAKYTQPDAANFNSWRRHLRLSERTATEELSHSWEDVKAMFNGGTRKRTFSLHAGSAGSGSKGAGGHAQHHHHHAHHPHHAAPQPHHHPAHGLHPPPTSGDLPPPKTLRCSSAEDERPAPASAPAPSSSAGLRPYPVIPVPSKGGFGVLQKIPPPLFPHPYGFPAFSLCPKKDEGSGLGDPGKANGGSGGGAGLPGMFWPAATAKDALYPPFPMFWPAAAGALPYPIKSAVGRAPETAAGGEEPSGQNTPKEAGDGDSRTEDDLQRSGDEDVGSGPPPPLTPRSRLSYISAFRPVVKDAESIAKLYGSRDLPPMYGARGGYLSPDPLLSEGESLRSASPDLRSASPSTDLRSASPGTDVDVESNRFPDEDEEDETEEEGKLGRRDQDVAAEAEGDNACPEEPRPSPGYQVYPQDRDPENSITNRSPPPLGAAAAAYLGNPEATETEDSHSAGEDAELRKSFQEQRGHVAQPSPRSPERGEDGGRLEHPGTHVVERDIENMAKDELQKLLVEQMDLRKKLEREFQSLKDNFQDQMKRELAYREEMVQQLQIVRDTLCNELDQERKARYAIQQKLKEAHDALHHFSCKMLTPRHCTGNCSFRPPLLPQ